MRKPARFALFLSLLLFAAAAEPRRQHPSKASEVLATYTPKKAGLLAPAVAADALLQALDDNLREQCTHPLDCEHRSQWTNVPPGAEEDGVRLGDLNDEQLQRACDLLAAALSAQGYTKVRDILLADDRLLRNGRPRTGFGAENYWLGIYGTPDEEGEWGLQLDGHHIAVNLSFAGGAMSMSPSFFGTQPAKYERGGKTIVPLDGLAERAYALLSGLTEEQRERAIQAPRRGRIVAGAGRDGVVPEPIGLACEQLDKAQNELLIALLEVYVGDLPERHAAERMEALRAEIPEMFFAWSGPLRSPGDVSYRLQGPTLLIEYACQDLGGDPLDHLHSMYRNPENEYGVGR